MFQNKDVVKGLRNRGGLCNCFGRVGFATCGLGFATRSLRSLVGSLRSHSKESEREGVISGFERRDMVGVGWGFLNAWNGGVVRIGGVTIGVTIKLNSDVGRLICRPGACAL